MVVTIFGWLLWLKCMTFPPYAIYYIFFESDGLLNSLEKGNMRLVSFLDTIDACVISIFRYIINVLKIVFKSAR
jgi:hypothetical protein